MLHYLLHMTVPLPYQPDAVLLHAEPFLAAVQFALQYHTGQLRKDGSPFITHPIAVAQLLVQLGADETTIIAGILHDTMEDTPATLADITSGWGREVAFLVDAVTKLPTPPETSDPDTFFPEATTTHQKLEQACKIDPRAALVKLADRLHNLSTIAAMPPHKQQEKAAETINFYVPLAREHGYQDIAEKLTALAEPLLEGKSNAS